MGINPTELLIVLAVVVLLFGAKKIPELAKGIGNGIKEFKKASHDDGHHHDKSGDSQNDSTTPAAKS